jgi:putative hydrolase of the HAD superfamily
LKKYQHIFFDLDHTIWDYDRNSSEVLLDLYEEHELAQRGIHVADQFIALFDKINAHMWSQYNKSLIDRSYIRQERFVMILAHFGINDRALSDTLSEQYLYACPKKSHLMPHAREVLNHLQEANYKLHILTNGFDDVQKIKIEASGLASFFEHVITSDNSGAKKPSREIFDYALHISSASLHDSIMIGDNLQTDILGARNINMDQVFYNPGGKVHQANVTYEVHCLSSLKKIFSRV